MTTEELFAQMEAQAATEKEYCIIDPLTREISVPEVYKKIGVVSDEKTNRIYFQCPRIVGDNVVLTTYGIRVNYQNANGQSKPYPVDDVAVSGDNITFSWLLERPVTLYKGTINFVVCAIKTSGEEITNEWNTTLAQAEVLEGLEPDLEFTEDEESLVELLVAQCTQKLTEMSVSLQQSEKATQNANASAQEAKNATEDARSVIEQITKDSYLHTALESFINKVTATPTAYGNALVEKIEGYIRQNKTNGYQLFDASKIASKTQSGATVNNNGDGSFTISGSGTLSASFSSSYIYDTETAVKLLKPGILKLNILSTKTVPYFAFGLYETGGGAKKTVNNTSESSLQIEISQDDINKIQSEEYQLKAFFYGSSGGTITPITLKPMVYQDGDGTWEPFTGGEPAPNPDYPQTINGVGDIGFFDGELLNGYYKGTDGIYASVNNYVCNANKIPCNPNDKILIHTEDDVNYLYLLFYKADGTLISAIKGSESTLEQNAPNETAWFNFNIGVTGITSKTAKHITVTINGMYAVFVKSIGKNLFNPELFPTVTMDGVTVTNNGDGSFSLKGIATRSNNIGSNSFSLDTDTYALIDYAEGEYATGNFARTQVYSAKVSGNLATMNDDAGNKKRSIKLNGSDDYVMRFRIQEGVTYDCTLKPMLFIQGDDSFIPCQSNIIHIPISSPLFEGDQIIKQNGEYKLRRKWGMVVFDGSEDELWKVFRENTNNIWFYTSMSDIGKRSKTSLYTDQFIFSYYTISNDNVEVTADVGANTTLPIAILKSRLNTPDVSGFKSWLQSNPVTVVYELAESVEEELSPEAQKAIHSIMACDELTNLEIVGVPSDAEVQNQFLLPRNVDGALNTTAYATAKRNEITIAEQESSLQSRLQAIEAQILQEV